MRSSCTLILILIGLSVSIPEPLCPQVSASIENPKTQSKSPYTHRYLNLADSFYRENEFDRAFQQYEHALKLFQREQDWEGIVKSINMIALKFQLDRQYDTAIVILEENIANINIRLGSNHLEEGTAHYLLGVCLDMKQEVERSLKEHNTSLNIRLLLFGENHRAVAESYKGIGDLYRFTKQDYFNAERFYRKALVILESQRNEYPQELAKIYYNLASTYRLQEDYERANLYGSNALAIFETIPKNTQRYRTNTLSLLAAVSHDKGLYSQALSYYFSIIEELSKVENLNSYQKHQLGAYQQAAGVVYTKKKQFDSAYWYLRKSLLIQSQFGGPVQISSVYLNLGNNFMQSNNFDSAFFYLNRSKKIREEEFGEKHPLTSHSLRYLGDLFERNNLDSALVYYHRALLAATSDSFQDSSVYSNPDTPSLEINDALLRALWSKGKALQSHYKKSKKLMVLHKAVECFELAMEIIDRNSLNYQQEGAKLLARDYYHGVYEDALESFYMLLASSYQEIYLERVFDIIEASKARILLESLDKLRLNERVGLPDSIVQKENNLKSEISFVKQTMDSEQKSEFPDRNRIKYLEQKLFQATRDQEVLNQSIKTDYPSYFDFGTIERPDLHEIQSRLDHENAIFYDFFWGDSAIYLNVVSKDTLTFRKIDLNSVETKINDYLHSLVNGPQFIDRDQEFEKFTVSAHGLYQELFRGTFTGSKSDAQRLVISPDGLLQYIPMESLIQELPPERDHIDYKNLKYMLMDFDFNYVYSANLWSMSRESPKKKNISVVAFGYGDENFEDNNIPNSMDDLPGTQDELAALSKHFKTVSFLGPYATEVNFKTNAGDYDIVHLATHGESDSVSHLNNRLRFNTSPGETEDGVLYAYELYNVPLKSQLVVLSSCESGIGTQYRGEGVYSMSRAFLYAGCPTTVMSLWKISDKTTPMLFEPFYRNISKGKDIDESLRIAKLDYIKKSSNIMAHPSYWAAMVVQGNIDGLPSQKNDMFILVILILTLILILTITKVALDYRKSS